MLVSEDSMDDVRPAVEVSAGACLLDLPVADADYSLSADDSNLLLPSTSDAVSSAQLLRCVEPLTPNTDATESDRVPQGQSLVDTGPLVTLNGVEHCEPGASENHLSLGSVADLLSDIDDALDSHIDVSSQSV